MTCYLDLVEDFPKRCLKLLDTVKRTCDAQEVEVTLLLSVASSGLVIPMERLSTAHPSHDSNRYPKNSTAFQRLMTQKFIESFASENSETSWRHGYQRDFELWNKNLEDWTTEPLHNQCTNQVLSIIRNALAHGNIHTKGSNQITEIVFASKRVIYETCSCNHKIQTARGFQYIMVNPQDFYQFLISWLKKLSNIENTQIQ